jgi:hypothetical protein
LEALHIFALVFNFKLEDCVSMQKLTDCEENSRQSHELQVQKYGPLLPPLANSPTLEPASVAKTVSKTG